MHLIKNALGSLIQIEHTLGLAAADMTAFAQMHNQSQ